MAHFEKFKGINAFHMIEHDTRENTYLKENIDKERSYLNYNLCDIENPKEYLKELIELAKSTGATIRDDTNFLVSFCLTLPEDFPRNEEMEKQFFIGAVELIKKEFGEKSIVSAWVHKDESLENENFKFKPHIHIKFAPIHKKIKKYKDGRQKEMYIFNTNKCINRTYLRQFHNKLDEYMEDWMGFKTSVHNGATKNGNKTIKELKAESERLKKQKEYINKDAWLIIAEQKKIINEYWKDYKDISQRYWTAYKAQKGIISNSIWELKKDIRGAEKELQQGLDFIGNMSYGLLYAVFKLIGAFSLLHRENVLQRELKALESEFEALETTRRKVSNYQHNAKEKLSKSDLENIEETLENWEKVALGMNAKMRDTLRQREEDIQIPQREKEKDILEL